MVVITGTEVLFVLSPNLRQKQQPAILGRCTFTRTDQIPIHNKKAPVLGVLVKTVNGSQPVLLNVTRVTGFRSPITSVEAVVFVRKSDHPHHPIGIGSAFQHSESGLQSLIRRDGGVGDVVELALNPAHIPDTMFDALLVLVRDRSDEHDGRLFQKRTA